MSKKKNKPIVAVVGRPNVGKSTLFNVLAGRQISITEDTPGVTRDRIYADCSWLNYDFTLIDTGGIEPDSGDVILSQMREQAQIAIDMADVIIFMVDLKTGLVDSDMRVADMLRRAQKPVVLCVNKTDNPTKQMADVYEFYNLGIGDPFPISSANRTGIGDMLDEVVKYFRAGTGEEEEDDAVYVAVVGKPNVGKSSIVNRLIGENRVIVSDIAGTTRDAIDTRVKHDGKEYVFIDTAGLRRKNKIKENLERYMIVRTVGAVERADITILVIDAQEGITEQDAKIAGIAHERGKAVIVAVNKWDLVPDKDTKVIKTMEDAIRERMAPFTDFPIIFGSALTKQRIFKVLETAKDVFLNRRRKVSTHKLNEEMLPLIEAYPPPSMKGKYIKIKYCMQIPDTHVPSFVFYANLPQYVKEPYKRFLENKIRERWDFSGCPINIFIRQK